MGSWEFCNGLIWQVDSPERDAPPAPGVLPVMEVWDLGFWELCSLLWQVGSPELGAPPAPGVPVIVEVWIWGHGSFAMASSGRWTLSQFLLQCIFQKFRRSVLEPLNMIPSNSHEGHSCYTADLPVCSRVHFHAEEVADPP